MTTTTTQRYSRSLAAAALVGLVLPLTAASPAGAEETAYSGFSTVATATPVRVEIYEPTIPIPANPQAEFEMGYTRVETDTGSSRGRASYLWPGDSVGEGAKTVIENLGLPEEISGPIAAQGYPFQVNAVSPSGEDSAADEPFPGMVMRTQAGPEKTTARTGYSTDCQVSDGTGSGKDDGGDDGDSGGLPGLPGIPGLPGLPGIAPGASATTAAADADEKKHSRASAEEPEASCQVPEQLAALVDFGGYASASTATNDGTTVQAVSRAALSDIDLLGGVITISGVHARADALSDGATGKPSGKAGYGTLAIAGQEFTVGPDGVEGGGQQQPIPGLPDDPAKALAALGIQITAPEPTYERDGDKAISTVAGLVIDIDTHQLRSMLDSVPFDEIVNQVPDETGKLKSALGAAVHLSPRFVITLGDSHSVVDTVQGIEFPAEPVDEAEDSGDDTGTAGNGGGGGNGGAAGAAGSDAPGGDASGAASADGDLTGADPVAAGLPPLNSIPGALTVGAIALAAAAGTWLRKIGAIALGGAGSCPHGLDSGLPDLRKA